ncbi:MAG: bifunctional metallophosphatase/5'-nucleotidase [Polyangiales bacterium]
MSAHRHPIALFVLSLLVAPPSVRAEGASSAQTSSTAPFTLSIVSTNDLHGRIEQLPLFGGYVRNLREARRRDHGAVLLLDAGDMFQGTLESNLGEGAAVVRAYDALGYTAATVGNHELDYGPAGPASVPSAPGDDPLGALVARVKQAHFAVVSANLKQKEHDAPGVPGVRPSVLREVHGVKVGIVGGLTKDALMLTQPANVGGLSLSDLGSSIATEAAALRAQGASLVIALVHAGGECHDFHDPADVSSCDPKAEVFELASQLEGKGVDLIVAGHTHDGVAHRVHGIPVIEAYANGRAFGRVDLQLDRQGHVLEARIFEPHALCEEAVDRPPCTTELYEGKKVDRDAKVSRAIAHDLERAKKERARPLGVELTSDLPRVQKAESALGNLVADLLHEDFPDADAVVNNGGSVRTGLPAGKLTYGRLFELFPFDNAFVTLHIDARTLAVMIANNLQADRGFLSISGLRAVARCERGKLAVELLRPSGERVAAETQLRVVTSDFLASGGDGLLRGLALPATAIEAHPGRLMRDALVKGLSAFPGGHIAGEDPRWLDPAHPRVVYPGQRPVACAALRAGRGG